MKHLKIFSTVENNSTKLRAEDGSRMPDQQSAFRELVLVPFSFLGAVFLLILLMSHSAFAQLVKGHLTASHPNENSLLQQRLREAVASGNRAGLASGGSLLVSRRSGEPLRVMVSPLQGGLPDLYGQLAALVFVSAPETAPLSRSAALRTLYGLTPAEARIADLLAGGREVADIATKSGITLETARFHVKRVLTKTGTRRQTELIRLIMSLPGPVEKPKSLP